LRPGSLWCYPPSPLQDVTQMHASWVLPDNPLQEPASTMQPSKCPGGSEPLAHSIPMNALVTPLQRMHSSDSRLQGLGVEGLRGLACCAAHRSHQHMQHTSVPCAVRIPAAAATCRCKYAAPCALITRPWYAAAPCSIKHYAEGGLFEPAGCPE
jgi:hypothetical protein